ncbi:hypothetical protein ACKKBG_A19890 [Auxenochlorella protothecoides x Auxenochlorella symbiontica]
MSPKILTIAVLVLAVSASARRELSANDPGPKPTECSGTFTEEWKHDHIECHFCSAQLKCEVHGGTIRSEKVECEYDPGALSRATNFDCPVQNGKAACDFSSIKSKLPGCAYPYALRVLQAWIPSS